MLHQATIHLSQVSDNSVNESNRKIARKGQAGYDKFTCASISTLIGAFCVHFCIGAQYAWGSISPYFTGYFRDNGVDTNLSQFFLVLPLIVLISTIFFPIGMRLSSIVGSRAVILVGGFLAVGLTLISTTTLKVHLFFVLYAVGFGMGKGFMYPAPLNAAWSHLPGRKGFVSGIVVSGVGMGAFSFGILAR